MKYYRITKWQDKVSDCWHWWHHLINKGTPAKIVHNQDHGYAVYRCHKGVIGPPNIPEGKTLASWGTPD